MSATPCGMAKVSLYSECLKRWITAECIERTHTRAEFS